MVDKTDNEMHIKSLNWHWYHNSMSYKKEKWCDRFVDKQNREHLIKEQVKTSRSHPRMKDIHVGFVFITVLKEIVGMVAVDG